nr:TPM domain-containing protein [Methylocystis heyeri]
MLTFFLGGAWAAIDFPALEGRVTDQAGILSQPVKTALEDKLKNLEDKSSIQLVVATVRSLQGSDIEAYANGLFRAWKLGLAKKNNGVLFLVAPNDRKMRIEVGYGLEGVLTDAVSSVIIRAAVAPRFKAGDFDGGVERGVDAIIEVLSTDTSEWTRRAASHSASDEQDALLPLLFFLLFVFIIIYMSRNARGRGGGGGPFVILPPSGGSGWGGGSSSFGGDGGFSGGGGSSGGGGASGDW